MNIYICVIEYCFIENKQYEFYKYHKFPNEGYSVKLILKKPSELLNF